MKVYFVRHGETEGNVENVISSSDTKLSSRGLEQARILAQRFKTIEVEKIISSSHERAQQTASEIARTTWAPVELSDQVIEKRSPSKLIGHSLDSPEVKEYVREMRLHVADRDWHYDGDENPYEIFERAVNFLNALKKRPDKRLLVVSHAGFLRYVMAGVLLREVEPRYGRRIFEATKRIANTGITVIEYSREKGEWQLVTWNDYAHLGDTHES